MQMVSMMAAPMNPMIASLRLALVTLPIIRTTRGVMNPHTSDPSEYRRTVEASMKVDPDLIGGVVLQAGSMRVDASVRGRLERLRHELAARA